MYTAGDRDHENILMISLTRRVAVLVVHRKTLNCRWDVYLNTLEGSIKPNHPMRCDQFYSADQWEIYNALK